MKSTVVYTLISPFAKLGKADLAPAIEAQNIRHYLRERGIDCRNIYPAKWAGRFVIDYKSAAQRTATELVMSGCSRTCKLTAREDST